ncbi:hypothetical protein NDU88_009589 [Pleurodeles waltl]|uniref:Uncharacterized protein n=1 Tax=Pleurodeles waltl TaxID=8319 RepID=A0AAV7PT74_PLEWA|nr:hypothetical protein NDU88_009589 [Pleurodeles waltl]
MVRTKCSKAGQSGPYHVGIGTTGAGRLHGAGDDPMGFHLAAQCHGKGKAMWLPGRNRVTHKGAQAGFSTDHGGPTVFSPYYPLRSSQRAGLDLLRSSRQSR